MKKEGRYPIEYSCYLSKRREGEKFTEEHAVSYIVSGSMSVSDADRSYLITEGELYFYRRNNLVKYVKNPPVSGVFRSVSLFLDQDFLRKLALELGYHDVVHAPSVPFLKLSGSTILIDYMKSLLAFENLFENSNNESLLEVKRKEAVLILIAQRPEIAQVLFDFSEPGKIDLEKFMNKNFHFKADLKRLAYLSGRSLSTFKRDFEKIFSMTPSRWLQHRRLEEARFLISQKHQKVNEVYLEVGFEDFSHFSYSFKKSFGVSPSEMFKNANDSTVY